MSVEFTSRGIRIDGVETPLYSGTIHYWRLERALWGDLLDSVKSLGFGTVETYIPWSVHEVRENSYDFGEVDPSKDLSAFLSLCRDRCLRVLVRPGPHINAEMSNFGLPEWILHDREIMALDASGSPAQFPFFTQTFPIPSYASGKFYEKAEGFFRKLTPILMAHQHPLGAVVAIQSDNETCFFFRERAYTLDYHPDSIGLYRKFLAGKYGRIEALESAYGRSLGSFGQVDPPRGFNARDRKEIPYYLDWVEYKEYQVFYAIKRFAEFWKAQGLNVPVFHNAAWQTYTPIDLSRLEREACEVCGIDMYANRESSRRVKETVKFLSGMSRLPFIPEFGSGAWFDNQRTFQPEEQEFTTFYALMHGIKAFNYYMIVERERWQGSPITRDNRIRKPYHDSFSKILRFLDKTGFHRYRKRAEVLVLKSIDSARFASAFSVMDPNPQVSNTFIRGLEIPASLFVPHWGLGLPEQESRGNDFKNDPWVNRACDVLDRLSVDYDIGDTHLGQESINRYPVVFCSSYEIMSSSERRTLLDYKASGGNLVIGPVTPIYDERLEESPFGGGIEPWGDFSRFDPDRYGLRRDFRADAPNVELSVHISETGTMLFAANTGDAAVEAEIIFSGRKRFAAEANGSDMDGEGSVKAVLAPYTVCVWSVEETR